MSDNKEQTHSRRLILFVLHADGPLDEQLKKLCLHRIRRVARHRTTRCVVFAATRSDIKPRSQRNATQRKTTHGAARQRIRYERSASRNEGDDVAVVAIYRRRRRKSVVSASHLRAGQVFQPSVDVRSGAGR